MAIIEPSHKHYYQPLWTLVGAGAARAEDSVRDEADFIPEGTRWIQERAEEVDPVAREVRHDVGPARGLRLPGGRAGHPAGLGQGARPARGAEDAARLQQLRLPLAPKTWELIQEFDGGTALFTHPATPVKCAGAPQKIMYLAADHLAAHGQARSARRSLFGSGGKAIFGVKPFARRAEGRGGALRHRHPLPAQPGGGARGPARGRLRGDARRTEGRRRRSSPTTCST